MDKLDKNQVEGYRNLKVRPRKRRKPLFWGCYTLGVDKGRRPLNEEKNDEGGEGTMGGRSTVLEGRDWVRDFGRRLEKLLYLRDGSGGETT